MAKIYLRTKDVRHGSYNENSMEEGGNRNRLEKLRHRKKKNAGGN
jgi:hypothetical protein